MNISSFASLLASLSCFAVGCLVYFKDRARLLNQSFALITFLAGAWTSFPFLVSLPSEDSQALLLGRTIYALAAFVPPAFYYFVAVLLGIDRNEGQRRLVFILFTVGAIFAICSFSPIFIRDITRSLSLLAPSPGPLYPPFMVFFALGCGYAFYQCFNGYRAAAGSKRNQLRYVLTSFAFAYTAGFLHFLAAFNVPELFPHDFLLILFAGTISYAIARHRLMDITVVMHKGLTYALVLASVLLPVYVAFIISERATLFSIPPLLAGTLVFSSGLWILLKNPTSATNRLFGLLCLGVCTWLFSFFMIYSTSDFSKSLFWGRFLYVGVVYIPAVFYHFCVKFLELPGKRPTIWGAYAVSTAFLILIPTNYLIDGQYTFYWGNYPKAGSLHPLFAIYFYTAGALSLYHLYVGHKARAGTAPQEATRTKFVFWASLVGYTASVDFAQSYGLQLYPPGFAFVSLWVLLFAYAIAKYQLLDISVFISKRKTLSYAEGFAIILSFYVVTLLLIRAFTGLTEYVLAAVLLAASLICAELLVNLQKRMEWVVGKTLFRKKYDAYETLTAFSRDMVTILDLKNLYDRFLGTLSWVLNIPAVSLFVLDKEKQVYGLASSRGPESDELKDLRIPSHHPLPRHLMSMKTVVVREELEYGNTHDAKNPTLETLKLMRSEVCFPLVNQERLVGFCNLGPRDNREMYTPEDLGLLTTLAQNAAIALDNALLYEDLKRSQLLMRRTDRLRSLETIAGGFAHEIRNPLTSIKTFIQLAPERKDDPEFISGFSKVVNDDVHRIERLIEEILDYARYMKPRLTEEDLNDIVSSCLYFVKIKAESLGVRIEQDLASDLPYVMLDRQHLKQILLNLLLNAMDAMSESGGRLTIRTHRLLKPGGEEWVQVEVADTGPGIESANLEHIFDPFYTTKHESGEREGTGLGLAIVHQIVQEHSGTIQVDSSVGKGTTFYINLPVSPSHVGISSVQE